MRHIKSLFLFPSRPFYIQGHIKATHTFVMALDQLFLVVYFRTAASIVSYMATLARLYMLSDIDSQVWSVLHINECFFKSGDARMLQVMVVPL